MIGHSGRNVMLATMLLLLLMDTESRKTSCRFPKEWEGTWFQSSVRPYISIDAHKMSNKGTCAERDLLAEKFIVKVRPNCHKCIVFHQKHPNVIQYKESVRCVKRAQLSKICGQIAGDANLYSMFRVDSQPMECPFGGSYLFSYNRGAGECSWPQSHLEGCTDPTRLVFYYQACPNVVGSELKTEEVECHAGWKDGNRYFLVGKLDHPHAINDEDKFRCFTYEYMDPLEPSQGLYLAQSGDATCNGLYSPKEGSKALTINKAPSKLGCTFPNWLSKHRQWSSLDGSFWWTVTSQSNLTLVNSTTMDSSSPIRNSFVIKQSSKVVCHKIARSTNPLITKIIFYKTVGCQSGFVCAEISPKTDTVLRVRMGSMTRTLEYACDESQFQQDANYLLLAKSPDAGSSHSGTIIKKGLYHITKGDSTQSSLIRHHFGQQLSAAVRTAEDTQKGQHINTSSDFCQDGTTVKTVSMVLDCTKDLQLMSSCNQDLSSKGYDATHSWLENNGTNLIRVYEPQESSIGSAVICLRFKLLKAEGVEESEEEELSVENLDTNCLKRPTTEARRAEQLLTLSFAGDCTQVSGATSFFSMEAKDKLFMILLNLSLFLRQKKAAGG